MKRSFKRIGIPALAIGGVVVVLAALKFSQISMLINFGKEMEEAGPPPEAVNVAKVEQKKWRPELTAVGTVAASKGVTLSNDAAGTVSAIRFDSGDRVRKGAVLVELDSSVERAQLASVSARLKLAESNLSRTRALVDDKAVSQSQLETEESSFDTAKADAAALRAQIARKTVRAPFAGQLGIRMVNVGQYLSPGTPVAVLQSSENEYVDFSLPQTHLEDLEVGQPVRMTLGDQEDSTTVEGTLAAIDPSIDEATRTVRLRATTPEGQSKLKPGMFVQVEVLLGTKSDVVIAPVTAIVHASYGDSIFVTKKTKVNGQEKLIAEQRFIKAGSTRGDFTEITEGLSGGEEVVTSGAFKLQNKSPIKVVDDVGPTPQTSPNPENK